MISAIVHTFNEETNIGRCLSSLLWVDEVIIVDMGSTDKTVAIAKEFKATIYPHPYTGFVEPARNFGIAKAKGEWILIVDADEEVPQSLSTTLLSITKQMHDDAADFYRIPRKNILFKKWIRHGGWWPDYQIRFFTRGSVEWVETIHGIPITYGKGKDLEAKEEYTIHHYNYKTVEQFVHRLNRYTTIAVEELHKQGKKCSLETILSATTNEFLRRFFAQEGYRDGFHGFAVASLQAFSEMVTYLKLWEKRGFQEESISLSRVEHLSKKNFHAVRYWIFHELLKNPHNLFQEFLWRVKKKIIT